MSERRGNTKENSERKQSEKGQLSKSEKDKQTQSEPPNKNVDEGKAQTEKDGERKSIVVSRIALPKTGDETPGIEETEITAQVSIPPDGGWAWVVLASATIGLGIVDGIAFTFGPLLPEISKELQIPESLGAFVNSIEVAIYFLMSPVVSALVNRFGFRAVGMLGSILSSIGMFGTYFSTSYTTILLLYGVLNGMGLSINNFATSIVCGYYFEKWRAIALTCASAGTGIGIMILYPLNVLFVEKAGWRTLVLFQAGLIGSVYFLSMTYLPIVNLTIEPQTEKHEATQTVTYLPAVSEGTDKLPTATGEKPTTPERLLKTVSSSYYPTAADVVHEAEHKRTSTAGTSAGATEPRPSIINLKTTAAVPPDQLKKIKSIATPTAAATASRPGIQVTVQAQERSEDKSCCARIFQWKKHTPQARPMYRDDAFYTASIKRLSVYQENVLSVPEKDRTGLEYQLAVTRTAAVDDLQERHGVFTTAARRVLASMLDPKLLKRPSFIIFCSTGFFIYSGVLVPYVYTQARALHYGLSSTQASFLVSALSFANILGRGVASVLLFKFSAITIYGVGVSIAGLSTMLSGISYSAAFQYSYAILFGLAISPSSCLRPVIICDCYGLENLTNGTGYALMIIGLANIFSTPLAAVLKENFGYKYSFCVAGGFVLLAGLITLIPLKIQLLREKKIENEANVSTATHK